MKNARGISYMTIEEKIANSRTYLGMEFGSTRIKGVLIDDTFTPIATGSHDWENRFENGYWTYALEDIITGMQSCYKSLAADVSEKYGITLTSVGAIGISAMMHGYMPFDSDDNLLVPFRTWRNTTTETAADELSALFGFNIPQRWSIAHLYQAILNGESHISKIAHITTLAGYIHYLLTGRREVGVGEASGIFPIDSATNDYDTGMIKLLRERLADKGFSGDILKILPKVKNAGDSGAVLTEDGAALLDPSENLCAGIPLCPPEGDAGTGMAATNSVRPKTGNVSAGTSIFSMLVLDGPLSAAYPEIDMVTTPDGSPVAMVHCNNCCAEIDAWAKIFGEFASLTGHPMKKAEVYDALYYNALNGDADCGGVVSYNFLSSEPVMKISGGKPMYFRSVDSSMNLANFFRAQIVSAVAALKIGMDLLFDNEKVTADKFTGHGGLFKTKGVAQQILADGLNTPVSVMKTAGEGGAWGMALLAAYMVLKNGKTLPDFLDKCVFSSMEVTTLQPTADGKAGFDKYIENYKSGITAAAAFDK